MERSHHEFSPSKLQLLSKCPASYYMSRGIKAEISEAAKRGEKLHKALETGNYEDINVNDVPSIEFCRKSLEKVKGEIIWEENIAVIDDNFEEITSGYVDAYTIDEERDIVIAFDFKFGNSPVHDAKDNMQAKAYSLGLMQKYDKDCLFVFLQPLVAGENYYLFKRSMIPELLNEIKTVIEKAKNTLDFNPGEWCGYCLACKSCPAYSFFCEKKGELITRVEHVTDLTPEKLSDVLRIWRSIKKRGEEIEAYAKKIMLEGTEIKDFKLVKRSGEKKVNDANACYNALIKYISHDDFMQSVSISLSTLKEAFAKAEKAKNPKKTLKAIAEEFEVLVEPYIVRSSDSFILKYVGNNNSSTNNINKGEENNE